MDPEELAQAQAEAMAAEAEYREMYGIEDPGQAAEMEDPDYYEYDVDQQAAAYAQAQYAQAQYAQAQQ